MERIRPNTHILIIQTNNTVLEGMDVVKEIEKLGSPSGATSKKIKIAGAWGVILLDACLFVVSSGA